MPENKTIENRIIRMKLVDGTKINGQVNIKGSGDHDRLSDLIRHSDDGFLVVYKAQLYEEGLDFPSKLPTVFVNKSHILWATPDENQK
jgi:hypothetical protein